MNGNVVRFEISDRDKRTILIPNLSPEFSQVAHVAMTRMGYRAAVLPLAGPEAIELGKNHVHNDICFPAQLNVGEILYALQSGEYPAAEAAAGLGKNCRACRALQYSALARGALDQAGFSDVPIITSGADPLGAHPGFQANLDFRLTTLRGLLYTDALNDMRQKTLPYELSVGATEQVHQLFMKKGMESLSRNFRAVKRTLREAVEAFNAIPVDRTRRRPVVAVLGEILVNYHPSANMGVVRYLLDNGVEPYLPPMLDFFHMDVVIEEEEARRGFVRYPMRARLPALLGAAIYRWHIRPVEKILSRFRYHEPRFAIRALRDAGAQVIDSAFSSGEAWLLPGEMLSLIERGVNAFVIVQPFGCLPNHITGRGIVRAVKDRHPHVTIVALDYDPDVSQGNLENRLQMLIMTAKARGFRTNG